MFIVGADNQQTSCKLTTRIISLLRTTTTTITHSIDTTDDTLISIILLVSTLHPSGRPRAAEKGELNPYSRPARPAYESSTLSPA